MEIQKIAEAFEISGRVEAILPFGSGHINSTYRVSTQGEDPNYILQRINHHIFTRPDKLQENIIRVTEHLAKKSSARKDQQLRVIYTKEGQSFLKTESGEYWRMYTCIENAKSYDLITNPTQAFEGGKAFGRFLSDLADLPGGPVFDIIANFHNIRWRMEQFEAALQKDPLSRAKEVQDLIDLVHARKEEMEQILLLGEAGKIPLRITHNDTKFNNVLFDEKDQVICVVDLDTVMNGYVHYDFGDSIRSATNTGEEDDADLSKISMDIKLFEAYTRGYLQEIHHVLNQTEIDYLAHSAALITFIMALRFLTDYLDGDHYYKIHHPEHNIQRARAQFQLLSSMDAQMPEMKKCVAQISHELSRSTTQSK